MEDWIVAEPDLVGEPLLVLGRQLAEFEEDKDRLDVLAVDQSGELVLIELKISEDFRVTDLQALAYAGAYAKRTREQLAQTLRKHLNRSAQASAAQTPTIPDGASTATDTELPADDPLPSAAEPSPASSLAASVPGPDVEEVSLDDAKGRITEFLQLDDFEQWSHSQHVRIKLIAPDFPRRVLHTVKWLGDVYDMPIEAINARLFETAPNQYSIAFERLLTLAGEEEFDLTVRELEDRKRDDNLTRRPAALPLLVKSGAIKHGQTLWLASSALTKQYAHLWNANDIVFQVRVHAPPVGAVRLAWKPDEETPEQLLAPSVVPCRIWNAVVPDYIGEWTTAVASNFTVSASGKTLEQLAEEIGAW